ncbi:ribosomal protection-like ABC-F family protein [Thiospirillum jenense]|uniref:Probable ATP-binding protein YheS n=1 Tax=Thiospirillum jenense TaxID=1653858 RepID=A0A839HGW9_9GAMM|nr:ATP-binding cassette domain-containing protein [Thiospirillum jenense]MBB1126129.1 ATP-binding cassette domain-containing protein [Thiospirillum jenense]
MLEFINVSLRRGSKLLFADVNLRIYPGHKVGIVGANGCGKSSLFALINGELTSDSGDVRIPIHWQFAQVAQHTPTGAQTALDFVMDGDAELRAIQRALNDAHDHNDGVQQGLLHERLDHIGGYTAESRAAQLLNGLGFQADDEQRPVNQFSGGWRMRLALAQALMCRSDVLLLDEPTNHLDLDAVIWLESWLRNYPGTLLLISHDRDFLDAITGQIAHIDNGQIRLYAGNYSAFERQRAEQLAQQHAAYIKQQRDIADIQQFVTRFRAKATKARQAQSRLKTLERMELIAPAHVDSPFHFTFIAPPQAPHPLLQLERVTIGYADQPLFQSLSLTLVPGQRVALLGPNGAGKSTLIKTLAGVLTPLAGHYQAAQGLRIGYFAQHQMDQLHPDDSPLTHVRRLDPDRPEQQLRDYLGGFHFSGDMATTAVRPFSGGEKARLALALMIYQRPNLLLLDEPTNHLDLDMRHALTTALQDFAGAMILVSHDRHLLRATCDELWLVLGGKITPFNESLDEYPAWLATQQAAFAFNQVNGVNQSAAANKIAGRKEQRQRSADTRQRLQPLRQQLRVIETQLAKLTDQQTALEQALAAPALYEETAKSQLLKLIKNKQQVDSELAALEQEWLEKTIALEAAQAELDAMGSGDG